MSSHQEGFFLGNFQMGIASTLDVASEIEVESSCSTQEPKIVVRKPTYIPLIQSHPKTILHPKLSKYRDECDESETEQQYIRFDDEDEVLSSESDVGDNVESASHETDPIDKKMRLIFADQGIEKIAKPATPKQSKPHHPKLNQAKHKPEEGKRPKLMIAKVKIKTEIDWQDNDHIHTNQNKDASSQIIRSKGSKQRSKKKLGRRNLNLGPHDSVVTVQGLGSNSDSKPVMVVVRNIDSEDPICEPLGSPDVKKSKKQITLKERPGIKTKRKKIKPIPLKAKDSTTSKSKFPRIQTNIPTRSITSLHCVLCELKCENKKALIEHVKSHSADKKSFECPTCKKIFSQQCNLKRHMRCHSGERPFSCTYCKKLFADQGYLTTHLRYHTNTKPYTCANCDKSFFDRSNYVKHLKSHSGEKPYPCTICKKSFLQQSDLTRHTRVHSGERPFKCTSCDRSFTQHGDLTTHMRHHTGERPFVCSYCEKTFANKRYLNGHVKGQICLKKKRAEVPITDIKPEKTVEFFFKTEKY